MATPTASTLLLDEYFTEGDPRFLAELFASNAPKRLKAFAPRFYRDDRPFARDALRRYVDDGCLRPGHRALVKQLFKLAEAARDDDLLARFMVAFDAMPRRKMGARYTWDATRMQTVEAPGLVSDPAASHAAMGPETVATFSRRTRLYLCRRVFRYFRTVGRKDPSRYRKAVCAALALYRDESLQRPEQLLDAWGLVHVLYWGAPVLSRRPDGIVLRPGTALADLLPAPIHPLAWKDAFEPLLGLAVHARSRTVRTWALAMLRDQYSADLRALPLERLRAMLRSPHDEVLTVAIELLKAAPGLETMALDAWLELLAIENAAVVSVVCDLVARHVAPDRLSLAQCVGLASARVAPVAELGLLWAKARAVRTADELQVVTALGNAGAPLVRAEAVAWVVSLLEREPAARPEHLRELLDARHADTRALALAALTRIERLRGELSLWAALAESPYDDVRDALVRRMDDWRGTLSPSSLRHVWATALLAIHRGSRTKRLVLLQLAERLAERRDEVPVLLPLLRVGLRSVRPPERRAALAAIGRAAFAAPDLRDALALAFPELTLWPEASA